VTPAGFGRRIIEPGTRELVLIPGKQAPSSAPGLVNRDELKEQIRSALMSRIDPSVAARIPPTTLRAEITKLVGEIATEQRIQLNEIEEATLATELTNDMIGLAPLEPYLEDDEVTDVLVNGPYDVYVERHGKLEKTPARYATPNTSSVSRNASPLQSGAASTKPARWSTRASATVAASISFCRRSYSTAARSRSANSPGTA